MIELIDQWIDSTNHQYRNQRINCQSLTEPLNGYFSESFLATAHYVVLDSLPKPNFLQLRHLPGMGDFLDFQDDAITFKNHYYIARGYEFTLSLHFHELVHVAQWRKLGEKNFIGRYIDEIGTYGYKNAPLEEMAYHLQGLFEKQQPVDVVDFVDRNL